MVYFRFALNRLKVSFQFRVNATLSWPPLLELFGIQGSSLRPDMVNVRLASDNNVLTF